MKIVNVVGARPNFMKMAPLVSAYRAYPAISSLLVHTGQHYDERMSDLFFRQLGIPEPAVNLGVGGGTQTTQAAAIMLHFDKLLDDEKPDLVVVVGDVTSTLACSLVTVKKGVRLAHIEAGLRSFDRTMPEEINRIVTDSVSDLLFCTEDSGRRNLLREGQPEDHIYLVGNLMIDTLRRHLPEAQQTSVLEDRGLQPCTYALVTLHRPSNVDDAASLGEMVGLLGDLQERLSVVFPVHPRTRQRLDEFGFAARTAAMPRLQMIEPVGYLEFLQLMANARLVLTDSGGIQEETTVLGVPCLTLRNNTERPVTCELGTNHLVGTDRVAIDAAIEKVLQAPPPSPVTPPGWDGHAADRVAKVLADLAG